MTDFVTPGVMLREVVVVPPERLRFDVTGFVGQAERGPLNSPQPLTNWGQYATVFGDFVGYSYLPYAVFGFFRNGGERCYVVRVAHELATRASRVLVDATGHPVIRVEAIDEGAWANDAVVVAVEKRISTDRTSRNEPEFKLIARYRSGVRTVREEVFDHLSMLESSDRYFVRLINGEPEEAEYAKRVLHGNSSLIRVKDLRPVKSSTSSCPQETNGWKPLQAGSDDEHNFGRRGYRYYTGWDVDANDYFRPIPAGTDEATRRELKQTLYGLAAFEAVEELGLIVAPDLALDDLYAMVPKAQIPQKGILFACPPMSSLKDKEFENLRNGQIAMLQHCAKMGDRFAILDSPRGARVATGKNPIQDKNLIEEWPAVLRADPRSKGITRSGALYYPWLKEQAADFGGRDLLIPPGGHVAGIYARTDIARGFGKAPANEMLQGVIALECGLSDAEQAVLDPLGVNCLRVFSGRGLRVWGARTLSLDPLWRYVNVQRAYLAIVKSILVKLQWTVFEPNDRRLWDKITATLTVFFKNLLARGVLAGNTPEEAFLVKCNEETNPEDARERGEVITEIHFAPARPAEFIVVTIKRTTESLTVSEKRS